jgi:hypothetical protein
MLRSRPEQLKLCIGGAREALMSSLRQSANGLSLLVMLRHSSLKEEWLRNIRD